MNWIKSRGLGIGLFNADAIDRMVPAVSKNRKRKHSLCICFFQRIGTSYSAKIHAPIRIATLTTMLKDHLLKPLKTLSLW